MRGLIIIFILLIGFQNFNFAQQKTAQDSLFVKSYYDDVCVGLHNNFNSYGLSVSQSETENMISFQTDAPLSTGISVDYKWLTVSLSKYIGSANISGDRVSKFRGLQVGIIGKRFWFQSALQNYSGLHITDIELSDGQIITLNSPRADIEVNFFKAGLQYCFNPRRYSHMATIWQLERQLKSAGSATVGVVFNLYRISSDSSLIPRRYSEYFTLDSTKTFRHNTNLFINAGYHHTFVVKQKFFFNLGASAGLGMQSNATKLSINDMSMYFDANCATGWNSDRYYLEILSNLKLFSDSVMDKDQFHQIFIQIRAFVGMRISVRKNRRADH